MKPDSAHHHFQNKILASLPHTILRQLAPHLVPVELPQGQTLHNPGQNIDTIYFLEEGVCSVVVNFGNGSTVEVGIIGSEGFVGLAALMGARRTLNRFFMAIPGHGYSIRVKSLLLLADASVQLRNRLLRSGQSLFVQTAQTGACNCMHRLPERLARWLLMFDDRTSAVHIPITQDFLAMMLGTRSSSISHAAGLLQKRGFIAYSRGKITIQNRTGLMKAACECYQVVHNEDLRLALL